MFQLVFWLVVMVILLAIEAATLGLTTVWFAGGALVALIAAILSIPLPIQVVLFFVTSLVLVFFTRPIALKYFNRNRERTNVDGLIGKQAVVTAEINNLLGNGQVSVNGQEWSARSFEENGKYPIGSVLRIVAIKGVKLIVKDSE
ncbi:MAG: NfeD family protein [Lachnospiraceae bacterium]|jgi:membrane protein implicated in regulation of membrane protease activity|nr:NfeD family protein [Lachnospiraceae bacterium]